jgi:hypothetical protein
MSHFKSPDAVGAIKSMFHTEEPQVLNNYLLHGAESFFEKLSGFQLVKKFPAFMERESSLVHSQVLATCPSPEP